MWLYVAILGYTAIREYWGVPLNKIAVPQGAAFQNQFTPAVPEGTVADEVNGVVSV